MNRLRNTIIAIASGMVVTGAAVAASKAEDEAAIRAALKDITEAYNVKDADRAMASYTDDVHIFDLPPPLQQVGKAGNLRTTQIVQQSAVGHMTFDYDHVNVVVMNKEWAYTTAIVALAWKMKDGRAVDVLDRTTDVWRKIKGKWMIVHEHNSVPVDMVTGMAVPKAPFSGHTVPFEDKAAK